MEKTVLLVVLLVVLIFHFRHLFRALDFAQLVRVNSRQWRWIRRNKLVPYYLLFIVFVLLLVGGAIYQLVEAAERMRRRAHAPLTAAARERPIRT